MPLPIARALIDLVRLASDLHWSIGIGDYPQLITECQNTLSIEARPAWRYRGNWKKHYWVNGVSMAGQ